ncbi:gamma-aminobutyric acid receptor subunit alpha-4-like isoform X2 [Symsagittifera roscoffensis]|uniref:gamma-aminobutyric acid receptor subunit alpha-4-like isoform X2 n=1 Tax=Symsagittifera roscoffensis TaxID=84072 RepID=UPI00307B7476
MLLLFLYILIANIPSFRITSSDAQQTVTYQTQDNSGAAGKTTAPSLPLIKMTSSSSDSSATSAPTSKAESVVPPATKRTKPDRMPWNITDIITEGYDARLRPNFGSDSNPVMVEIDITVASVDRISEVNMDYTLTIYLRQYWTDSRLAYAHVLDGDQVSVLPVDGRITDKLWLPDTYFTNDKDSYLQDITVKNRMLRIKPHGQIIYGLRLSVTASCVFELKKFPHDRQNCSLNLESYGYNTKDIRLKWANKCVRGFGDVELPQFRVTGWNCTASFVSFSSGSYDRLFLLFYLERSVGYFVFQTYMPCIMVVCMSWVSFWINYESSPARVALGITTVLTMTTIFTSARASLPRFSYVKAIDIYLLTCFVFVFASLIEYAIVNYNFWKIKHRLNKTVKGNHNNNNASTAAAAGSQSMHNVPAQIQRSSLQMTTTGNQQRHSAESSAKNLRKVLSSDALTPDEMIALRLSTPTSAINSNSPDLPRKMLTPSLSANSIPPSRQRKMAYSWNSNAYTVGNNLQAPPSAPSVVKTSAASAQNFAKGYVQSFPSPRGGALPIAHQSARVTETSMMQKYHSSGGASPYSGLRETPGSFTHPGPMVQNSAQQQEIDQSYLKSNGSVVKRRNHSSKHNNASSPSQQPPNVKRVVYKPAFMVQSASVGKSESSFSSHLSPSINQPITDSSSVSSSHYRHRHSSTHHSQQAFNVSMPSSINRLTLSDGNPSELHCPPHKTKSHNSNGLYALLRAFCTFWLSLEIPSGERVIIIDRYSRCLFPTAFILFNAVYWWYYVS